MNIGQTVLAWGIIVALVPGAGRPQTPHLAVGTVVHVRLTQDLLSSQAKVGSRVAMEISRPVTLEGVVVIPEGAVAWGAVQKVKKGKTLDFDIEGVRLPNGRIVLLRCRPFGSPQARKDEIKLEIRVGRDVGAPAGTEFTAYLDQDLDFNLARPGEYVRIECISDPPAADILIDGHLEGNTPSIVNVQPGIHRIEFRLRGYEPISRTLNLKPGTTLRSVWMNLKKRP